MIYPIVSSTAFHYGPFSEKVFIKERGDLSGTIKVQYGYTVLFDANKKLLLVFINSGFNRHKRLLSTQILNLSNILCLFPL